MCFIEHKYYGNEALAQTFFEGLDYKEQVILNSYSKNVRKIHKELFELLDKLSKGNPIYEGEMPRTTTHRAAGIFDEDQSTTINAKLDAMNNNINTQFKQIALNQAPVSIVHQTTIWCGVCSSRAHETKLCKSNLDFVNYVGNAQ